MPNLLTEQLISEFNRVLKLSFEVPRDLLDVAYEVVGAVAGHGLIEPALRKRKLMALVNSRLNLNQDRIRGFIDRAASEQQYLNYREKLEIANLYNANLQDKLIAWCQSRGLSSQIVQGFPPLTDYGTIRGLHSFLDSVNVNRKDARNVPREERQAAVQRSLFGGFLFCAFDESVMHSHFSQAAIESYEPDFFKHLQTHFPERLSRDSAFVYHDVAIEAYEALSYEALADTVLSGVKEAYNLLANHCYFAIRLRSNTAHNARLWRLFSDITLFAEKHIETRLTKNYFKPGKIERVTKEYIGAYLDEDAARFDIANEGFFFRDCFILARDEDEGSSTQPYDVLVLFEKNERDDQVIPCPACRSTNVRGNSYSTLGVRSWECINPICPERSAYDRGNRFSLASIIRQEAISKVENHIPMDVRRRWRNDVVFGAANNEVLEMLVRHYSVHGDRIIFCGSHDCAVADDFLGRRISKSPYGSWPVQHGIRNEFYNSPFFKRFALPRSGDAVSGGTYEAHLGSSVTMYRGSCEDVLTKVIPANTFDAAITSPPYYNAREYSQWENIYTYLFDMYNSGRAVYASLKPGGVYLYNIFDYFDNENITAFSAMGKKRMILGAYIIFLFEKCGFEIRTNVIWYKGEIEGKRNFNQGNASPYYQLPFNCWEHCLIFEKQSAVTEPPKCTILKQRPVIKIVSGRNTYGHTAPYPQAIPAILLDTLSADAVVLDPYSGSMTTALAALSRGMKAVMIERDAEYYELGMQRIKVALEEQEPLFPTESM